MAGGGCDVLTKLLLRQYDTLASVRFKCCLDFLLNHFQATKDVQLTPPFLFNS